MHIYVAFPVFNGLIWSLLNSVRSLFPPDHSCLILYSIYFTLPVDIIIVEDISRQKFCLGTTAPPGLVIFFKSEHSPLGSRETWLLLEGEVTSCMRALLPFTVKGTV